MSKSMTAYGRASDIFSFGKLVVEIHSVNRKMLDIAVYLPRDFLRFDMDVRKWIASEVERGQVTVRVSLLGEKNKGEVAQSYLLRLRTLQLEWNQIAQQLGYSQESIDLRFLIDQLQDVSLLDSIELEQELKMALQRVVHAALDELIQMKLVEGRILFSDCRKRLEYIQEQLLAIEKKKQTPVDRYRQKIMERLQGIGQQIDPELEERIIRELVFLAERIDITEELVRLSAHIEQFLQHLLSTDKAIGRTLEFLIQEMFREINTLGSKSIDTDISIFVVTIKSELEKIREQIQNIE